MELYKMERIIREKLNLKGKYDRYDRYDKYLHSENLYRENRDWVTKLTRLARSIKMEMFK